MNKEDNFEFRDPEWVGRKLKLDKNTVYKFLQEGVIPAVQLGRKWFVSEKQLLTWMTEESLRQATARRRSTQAIDRGLRRMIHLSRASRAVVRNAYAEARRMSVRYLGTEHLLIALTEAGSTRASKALTKCGVRADALRGKLDASNEPVAPDFRPRRRLHARQAMRAAQHLATDSGDERVEPEHLLSGLLQINDCRGVRLLQSLSCDLKQLGNLLATTKPNSTKGDS